MSVSIVPCITHHDLTGFTGKIAKDKTVISINTDNNKKIITIDALQVLTISSHPCIFMVGKTAFGNIHFFTCADIIGTDNQMYFSEYIDNIHSYLVDKKRIHYQ